MQRENTEIMSSIDSNKDDSSRTETYHTPDEEPPASLHSAHTTTSVLERRSSSIGITCCGKNVCKMKHFKTFVAGITTLIAAVIVTYFSAHK